MKAYNTIYEGGTDEIVEKKSRFIAQVFPVETEEEVATILEQMKKKYWDARHNCYAFVLGETSQISRSVMMENHLGQPADRSWK